MALAAVLEHRAPRHEGDTGQAEAAPGGASSTAGQTARPETQAQRQRLLVTEDDADLRSSLAEILRMAGHEVLEAEDGVQALEIMRREPISLLLLDLHMPKCDGVGVLGALDPPPPMVVVYSAFEYFTPNDLREKIGPKVFRYLRKPCSPPQILAAVADAIESYDKLTGG
ncbi:MAG TPA: response regulator [Acidimicrobiales bacterium]|nr:response regulator [Acidimicrobiales bacterium]